MGRRLQPPTAVTLGVGGVVVQDDRVVLIRRGRAPARDLWTLPGGHLEPGESIATGIKREMAEETGLVVRVGPLLCLYQYREATRDGRLTRHFVVADHMCAAVGGKLRAGSDAAEVRMCTLAQASQLDTTPGLLVVLVRALAFHNRGIRRGTRSA